MKKFQMKKVISSLLAAILALTTFGIGFYAFADTVVAINSNNFKDDNFKKVVADWYDEDEDGFLSNAEIEGVTFISISGMLMDSCGEDAVITDLSGIEFFTACKRLRCGGVGLETLDVSKMPQLVELTCEGNNLTSLDVTQNTLLEWLNCSSNDLESLNVSNNTKLTKLEFYVNHLKDINLSGLKNLVTLRCHRNELASLNLSANTELVTLNCSTNCLSELDLSANTKLSQLTASQVGDQTVSAQAVIDNGVYYTAFQISDSSRITSTSVDRVEDIGGVDVTVLGYDGRDFVSYDIDGIVNGIDYYYDVGLPETEAMDVHIDVKRDFFKVVFYTNETKQTVLSSLIVNRGDAAQEPVIAEVPQCKLFDSWSEDFTNVNSDLEVYAVWRDDHDIKIVGFDTLVVDINCTKCGEMKEEYPFSDLVNARRGEPNYVERVDINHDGIINLKDFQYLKDMF